MYGLWQVLEMTKTDELYVDVGVAFMGRGGLVPWAWLETR